jgi:DHA1 family inner membrane transport protein
LSNVGEAVLPGQQLDRTVAMKEPEAFSPAQSRAAIVAGVMALLASGLMPLLLGALCDEHRITAQGIGQLGAIETLSMAVTTALASIFLPPQRLPAVGLGAALLLIIGNLATVGAAGGWLMTVRGLAGVPEGILLWIAIGLIARSDRPERRAGVLFTLMAAAQLAVAILATTLVMAQFGVDGVYILLAASSLFGATLFVKLPARYAPLADSEMAAPPSLKGAAALFATFLFQALVAGVSIYLVPLATEAGVGAGAAQLAIAVALAAQIAGGGLAIALSGRVNHLDVFLTSGLCLLGVFTVYALNTPSWLFVVASGALGLFAVLILPFFVPMTINADPSRRSAVHLGAAQLFGSALGPLIASLFVRGSDSRGVIIVCAALLVITVGVAFALNRSRPLKSAMAHGPMQPA